MFAQYFATSKRLSGLSHRSRNRLKNIARRRLRVELLELRALLTSYFVDSVIGNNQNSGQSPDEAWSDFTNIVSRYSEADRPLNFVQLHGGDDVNVIHFNGSPYNYGNGLGYQGLFLHGAHGEEGNPIILRGIGTVDIGMRSPTGEEMYAVYILQSSHIVVENFTISDTFGSAVKIAESTDITVRDNHIFDIDGHSDNNLAGVHVLGSNQIVVNGNLIENVYDRTRPGNANNRGAVIFGSIDTFFLDNIIKYDRVGLGFGIEYKHLGSLTPSQAAASQFTVIGNIIINATEFGISSAAPNSRIEGNLIYNGAIKFGDVGGTAQIANELAKNNTIVSTVNNSRTASVYYAPTEYPSLPAGAVTILSNAVLDHRQTLNGEDNTLEIARYGNDEAYAKYFQFFSADRNIYSTVIPPRFDVFGGDHYSTGAVYSWAEWQALGFDRNGAAKDLSLDEFYDLPINYRDSVGWTGGDTPRLALVPAGWDLPESSTKQVRLTRIGVSVAEALTVTLTSNQANEFRFPRVVTIPAGERTVDFAVSGVIDTITESLESVQLKATANSLATSTWLNIIDSTGVPAQDTAGVFQVPGQVGTALTAHAGVTTMRGEYQSEVGFAYVDDQFGAINGLNPSDSGWLEAAMARGQTIVPSGSLEGFEVDRSFDAGKNVVFYLVQNDSLANWKTSNPSNDVASSPIVFTSVASANPDLFEHLHADTDGSAWTLAWEDLLNGGDQNWTDIVVGISFKSIDDSKLVQFSFEAVDANGNKIERVCVGDKFFVNVTVADIRSNPMGVFSAALDVGFDASIASLDGDLVFGPQFPNNQSGTKNAGLVDELGGFANLSGAGNIALLARLPFTATAVGTFTLTGNAADELPSHEVSLVGVKNAVPSNKIAFDTLNLSIDEKNPWHNFDLAEDSNGDGQISPIDALRVINFLNRYGGGRTLATNDYDSVFADYEHIDVNNDGTITPMDALLVINALNRRDR